MSSAYSEELMPYTNFTFDFKGTFIKTLLKKTSVYVVNNLLHTEG